MTELPERSQQGIEPGAARNALLPDRAAGLFGSTVDDEESISSHEMTAGQLQLEITKISRAVD